MNNMTDVKKQFEVFMGIPQTGQIWVENHKRKFRVFFVAGVHGSTVAIFRNGRTTKAKLSRFNGKSGGYSFYMDCPAAIEGETVSALLKHTEETF